MVRINENIIFEFQTMSFKYDTLKDYQALVTKHRFQFIILFLFQVFIGMFIIGGLINLKQTRTSSVILLSVIVTVVLSFIILFFLKATGLIKNFHLGYLIPKRGLRDCIDEMNSEDKFIYVSTSWKKIRNYQRILNEDAVPSPIALLNEIENKKRLILRYSFKYPILYFIAIILFFGILMYGLNDKGSAVWGTALLISGYGYLFTIYVIGLSPIKSIYTWNILTSLLEKYIKDYNVEEINLNVDYEKMHKEIVEEMKRGI